jgi:hypothetical protein
MFCCACRRVVDTKHKYDHSVSKGTTIPYSRPFSLHLLPHCRVSGLCITAFPKYQRNKTVNAGYSDRSRATGWNIIMQVHDTFLDVSQHRKEFATDNYVSHGCQSSLQFLKVVMTYCLADGYQRFGRRYDFHLQG